MRAPRPFVGFIVGILLVIAGVALVILFAPPARGQAGHAAGTCAPRAPLVQHLARKWREAPIWRGVTDGGAVLEIFAAEARTTWTVAISTASGLTCLVATGEDLDPVPFLLEADPT